MKEPLIRTKNLCKTYENEGSKTVAVCGVSFVIQSGEFISIMGPSGSGKSTLMHLLGLLDRPTGGKYYLFGRDISTLSEDELARLRNEKIGFIFQAFNLLPRLTVYENIELPLIYGANLGAKERRERVMQALEDVMIEHRKDYYPNQLSGGEKQRVAIARALVNQPEIIFADEPTGNLDSRSGGQVMKILEELNEKGHTVILVTHETVTANYAKRILKVFDGAIVGDFEVSEEKRRRAERRKRIK